MHIEIQGLSSYLTYQRLVVVVVAYLVFVPTSLIECTENNVYQHHLTEQCVCAYIYIYLCNFTSVV